MVLAIAEHHSQETVMLFGLQYLEHKLPVSLHQAREDSWYDAV